MLNLAPYRLRLNPAPERITTIVAAGVGVEARVDDVSPQEHLALARRPFEGVVRATDGRVRVTCVTEMPDVTPAMIDWWFGWHLPYTERYRLWHPTAHVAATVEDDRSRVKDDRARYLDNKSHVDEYIGTKLAHLTIGFVPPETFGFPPIAPQTATAICAMTADRTANATAGKLVHYVLAVPGGSEMRSGFWLADVTHNVPIVNSLANGILNHPSVRRLLVPDAFALDLLTHCAEEMQHLARFLPALYEAAHAAGEN